MAYSKTTWVNGQSPAISAENLNHLEDGVWGADLSAATANGKANALLEREGQKELKSNKVTHIGIDSTDEQYPSAKCVSDSLNGLAAGISAELAEKADVSDFGFGSYTPTLFDTSMAEVTTVTGKTVRWTKAGKHVTFTAVLFGTSTSSDAVIQGMSVPSEIAPPVSGQGYGVMTLPMVKAEVYPAGSTSAATSSTTVFPMQSSGTVLLMFATPLTLSYQGGNIIVSGTYLIS